MEVSENGSNLSGMTLEEQKKNESPQKRSKYAKQYQTVYIEVCSIMSNTDSVKDEKEEQNQRRKEDLYLEKTIDSSEILCVSEGDDTYTESWEQKARKKDLNSKEKSAANNYKSKLNNLSNNHLNSYYSVYDIAEKGMLFEDLLKVYREVLLPRGWSCLVSSKGLSTTILYLYMTITKSGMPFTEKQVFIEGDMILHCSIVNREISPIIHNLVREGKHLKVQNLLDIEELIDEFDQRTVCQGMHNIEGLQRVNNVKMAYNDSVNWRHVLCPLIVNNDSLRCTRCMALSHALQRRTSNLHSPCSPYFLSKKRQRIYLIGVRLQCIRKYNHRPAFLKTLKE